MKGKGRKLTACSNGASAHRSREIGRIMVWGFDTGLPREYVEGMLRTHFSSCGEITDVYVPINYNKNGDLWRNGYIYFLGEGAVDKALQLHGSDVGGWNVSVKSFPFPKHANDYATVRVGGYDTSLSEIVIKRALSKLFSSLGKIDVAIVDIFGEDAAEKVSELNGSRMRGRKVTVELVSGLNKSTRHRRRRGGGYLIRSKVYDDECGED